MNANRNNNRRRGRNNNRGPGGGNQGNRIDSRARGNAPQLLEKYRKLAHDASLNGDRVQTEYYLQFADHYFRVIADGKGPKDENRARRDEREQGEDFEGEQDDEFELPGRAAPRQNRQDDRDDRNDRRDDRREEGRGDRGDRSDNADSPEQAERGEDAPAAEEEPNPFVRESRARRPRTAKPRESAKAKAPADSPAADAADTGNGFDPGVLPPSITRDEEAEAPRPARRTRRPRTTEGNGGETLETAN